MNWTKKNTVLIQATTGVTYQGCKKEGFQAFHPYKQGGTLLRIVREICFRIPFLPKTCWYNKEFLNIEAKYFLIWDPLITRHYIEWIHKKYPDAQINFKYANMVGNARHLLPAQIPKYVRVWTYDSYDSEKYGINLYKSHMYFPSDVKPLKEPVCDIFFVGRDKGRGDWLVELEKKLNQIGIITNFIITANGKFSERKPYYKEEIDYSAVTDCLSESRAVLNVVMENQRGITVRDAEALFFGIKLITTNKYIKDWELYDPNNIFVLDNETDLQTLKEFLNKPVHKTDKILLDKHTVAGMIDEITN